MEISTLTSKSKPKPRPKPKQLPTLLPLRTLNHIDELYTIYRRIEDIKQVEFKLARCEHGCVELSKDINKKLSEIETLCKTAREKITQYVNER